MTTFRAIASACATALFVVGCATTGSPGAAADQIVPPRMGSPGRMPPLQFPMSSATGSPISVDIEVVVDSTGVPIMSTFKAFGQTANQNRDALYAYVQSSTFRPALRDGQRVEGVYRQRLQFRVQR